MFCCGVSRLKKQTCVCVTRRRRRRAESWTHSAEFAGADEDPAFVQHAGIQVEHVIDVYSHKVLRQVPLQG